mgnify:CR=1 FL=1|jgi:hypothetical protein|tara:strand:- start:8042 stop:8236 length:195 start_codon:yes stop_codon:yes gene_type:complete
MSVIENIVNTLNWIYQYVPKELLIIILSSLVMFIFLEIGDRKRKKQWLKELEPKPVKGRKSKKD